MHWPSFLIGLATAYGTSVAFILFAMRHAKSHPPIRDEQEETLAGETTVTVTCPPSYGLRIVR